jgi:lipoprotein-releasing system permease protein
LNFEHFIAKRVIAEKETGKKISRPIITIAIISIVLGLAVMILSVAIVTGFKTEIRNKMIGFGSHIQIVNYDSNNSYETQPINKNQDFLPELDAVEGVVNYQVFAIKAGMMKTKEAVQVVVLKGIGCDFNWTFFESNLINGNVINLIDSSYSNNIVISNYIANLLKLEVGDKVTMYFAQSPPRARRFVVSGIYETGLEELDRVFALVDIKHIQRLNDWEQNQVSGYEILIDDFEKIDEYKDEITDIAGLQFAEDGSRLKIQSIKDKYPQIFAWLNIQDTNVWIILGLMVIVAGFNMVSGLLIIILERARMIGVLKSLGTQNWSIRKMFIYQSGYLIGKGMLWGNIIGILICLIQFYFHPFKLDPESYYVAYVPIKLKISHLVLLNFGVMAVTLLMMIIPSSLISRISPDKAIRFN